MEFFQRILNSFDKHQHLLVGPIDDNNRRLILDALGQAGSDYRTRIYDHAFSGRKSLLSINKLKEFVSISKSYLEHSIRANKRSDNLYHAYNLMTVNTDDSISISYLNENHPTIFTIADAKRGDIGNTSRMYAKAFYEDLNFDSVTIAPYMGKDSVEPFLEFENKFAILLALTSNAGAFDFQTKHLDQTELYKEVLRTSQNYQNSDRLMYVVGATKATFLEDIRKIVPNSFLLVPGVGAQGGSLTEVCKYGMNDEVGLLINSSRGIIYRSNREDFAEAAALAAKDLQSQMASILNGI